MHNNNKLDEYCHGNKFHIKYRNAMYLQYAIGWDHFFYGKISQEWLILYNDESESCKDNKTQQYSIQYILGDSIIKTAPVLWTYEIWGSRNE